MPAVPRPNKKAERIAFKIIGTPANLKKQKLSKRDYELKKRLVFEETSRVR